MMVYNFIFGNQEEEKEEEEVSRWVRIWEDKST